MTRRFLPLVLCVLTVSLPAISSTHDRGATPTPTPSPAIQAKDKWKSDVEAAFAKAKSSLAFRNNSHDSELLQQREEVFTKWLNGSESDQEALGLEAKRIVEECNRMSGELQPPIWSKLFGLTVLDYLARGAVVLIAALLVGIIIITARLNRHLWSTIEAMKGRLDRLEKPSTSPTPLGSKSGEKPQVSDAPAADKIAQQIVSAKNEVLGVLEQLRQLLPLPPTPPPPDSPDPATLAKREDIRELAQNAYLKDVLRAIPEDRQVTARYHVGHSSFLPDSSGELIVVLNDDSSNLGIVLPKTARLSSPDQFYMHYQEAYACERPSSGSMFILSPAIVQKEARGWKLTELGKLDLRG